MKISLDEVENSKPIYSFLQTPRNLSKPNVLTSKAVKELNPWDKVELKRSSMLDEWRKNKNELNSNAVIKWIPTKVDNGNFC